MNKSRASKIRPCTFFNQVTQSSNIVFPEKSPSCFIFHHCHVLFPVSWLWNFIFCAQVSSDWTNFLEDIGFSMHLSTDLGRGIISWSPVLPAIRVSVPFLPPCDPFFTYRRNPEALLLTRRPWGFLCTADEAEGGLWHSQKGDSPFRTSPLFISPPPPILHAESVQNKGLLSGSWVHLYKSN